MNAMLILSTLNGLYMKIFNNHFTIPYRTVLMGCNFDLLNVKTNILVRVVVIIVELSNLIIYKNTGCKCT